MSNNELGKFCSDENICLTIISLATQKWGEKEMNRINKDPQMHISLQKEFKRCHSKDRKSTNQESRHQSGSPRPHKTEEA